ncbi:MAG: succinylglutamate desuccinylase/aspartoacylase family protein [Helicobacteraceae bacterium]|jgi:hypothetical protein|nr:succinylglutamate desuccinylase/aspartoacylase family protein [Helicobacteraceae bacterium]
MRLVWTLFVVCAAAFAVEVWDENQTKAHQSGEFLRFRFYKLDGAVKGNTLLVVGGVHGDEPGGYFASALLATHYRIKKGSLWIAPNLNFESIIRNRRGVYGDMNRKFSTIKTDDTDYEIVQKIKEIIADPQVNMVMNLHDGHGFYRERWENTIFNPKAWGQTLVIDQKTLELNDAPFGNMDELATKITENLNKRLKDDLHYFSVRNTETKNKDEAMRLSLTYYAITHLKPAFGQETSKNIDALAVKVEYHLRSIEEMMKLMNIEYERDFKLNFNGIQKALNSYGKIWINDKMAFNLIDLRNILRFVPLDKNKEDRFVFNHPLGAVKRRGDRIDIYIGNKRISSLYPQYFDQNCSISLVQIDVDGRIRRLNMGMTFAFADYFSVVPREDLRINVIGFSAEGIKNESGTEIAKKDLEPRFSEDVGGKAYRVEFYRDESFCGTINARIK